jgi:HSP20 family molecular chaperone IbpA
MSIKDIESAQSRQIEMLRKKLRQEVNHLEESHSKNLSHLNEEHHSELSALKDRHRIAIHEEAEKKQQVLDKLRSQMESTQKMNSESLKKLKDSGAQNIRNERQRLSAENESIKSNHDNSLEDLNLRFHEKMKNIQQKGNNEVNQLNYEQNRYYANKQGEFQKKLNDQHNNFHESFSKIERENQKARDGQDHEFKRNRMTAVKNQQSEMEKISEGHLKVIKERNDSFKARIKEQDQSFEHHYNETAKVQDSTFKNLEERYEKVFNELKNNLKSAISGTMEKSNDPFYKFQELSPELTHNQDGVEIKVPIPAHAKQDLRLTLNGTVAIINFNRRYEDQKKNDDGSLNKVNKVESLVSKVPTNYKLDPKTVSSSYENGIMTFNIKKV